MNVSKEDFKLEIQRRLKEKKQQKKDTEYAIKDIRRRSVRRAKNGH